MEITEAVVCLFCDKVFPRPKRRIRAMEARGSVGPFCGKSCAAKFKRLQLSSISRRFVKIDQSTDSEELT